jgi:hypothetical protein
MVNENDMASLRDLFAQEVGDYEEHSSNISKRILRITIAITTRFDTWLFLLEIIQVKLYLHNSTLGTVDLPIVFGGRASHSWNFLIETLTSGWKRRISYSDCGWSTSIRLDHLNTHSLNGRTFVLIYAHH